MRMQYGYRLNFSVDSITLKYNCGGGIILGWIQFKAV